MDPNTDTMLTAIALPVLSYRWAKKDQIKNNWEKVETSFSPLQVNGGFLLLFPHHNNATHKIFIKTGQLASEIFKF